MPKDFRYNPWSDSAEAVSLTELYQVPAVSPYTIRLNEVPEVGDPSTMVVKEVTALSGIERTYGVTFTEVAAVPASGSFRPDYNTGAAGDDDWNTGTLLFAAADAGKLVEVTYNGLGTLASVKAPSYPAWFTDRGDGSDGDYAPTADETLSAGLYNYKSVNIPAGVTVTLSVCTKIKCLGAFVCNGNITVTASGGIGGAGGTGVDSSGSPGGAGATGNGSTGGAGATYSYYVGGAGGAISATFTKNILDIILNGEMPSGAGGGGGGGDDCFPGGAGGRGGGSLKVVAKSISVTGTITAKGVNGGASSAGGGGGGGGFVILIADTIFNTGTITVTAGSGGTGTSGRNGAAGSAGLVYLKELGAV